MKKIINLIILLLLAVTITSCTWTDEKPDNSLEKKDEISVENFLANYSQTGTQLYFFRWDGCPHCSEEQEYLETIRANYPNLKINKFETWYNTDNQKLLQNIVKDTGKNVNWVPVTFIWDQLIAWFGTAETTGIEIKKAIDKCSIEKCNDIVVNTLKNFKK